MDRHKIVIIGDSLAAARPDGFLDSERWPHILSERLKDTHEIANLSKGFSSTKRLNVELNNYSIETAKIVIIQLGIVDCVPRYFTSREHKIISKMPVILRRKLIRVLKSLRAQSTRRAYVSKEKFRQNLELFFSDRKSTPIYYIKILSPGNKFGSMNRLAYQSVTIYNAILDELAEKYSNVKLIEVDPGRIDELTLEDGYHLNRMGHLYLAELIKSSIVLAEAR